MFTRDNIYVYILNWRKVTLNSLRLYATISPIIKNTCIINCDETFPLPPSIKHIQLDDSHYYGSQYNHAIKDVKEGAILCLIVGDNIVTNKFGKIFNNAVETFNTMPVGVYAPNDIRSVHKKRFDNIKGSLYTVPNTDCGFWFIHPTIVARLRNIDYTISRFGHGIDIITIKESNDMGMLVLRDYSVETDQLDHTTNYNIQEANLGWKLLVEEYNKMTK
jgi:hypothetical protein